MPCEPKASSHCLHFSFARTPPHPRATLFGGASHPPRKPSSTPPRSPLEEDFLLTLAQPPPPNKTFQTGPWPPNTSISHTSLLPATTVLFHQPDPRLETQGSASMGENETAREREQGEGKKREGGRERETKETPGSKPQVPFRSPRRWPDGVKPKASERPSKARKTQTSTHASKQTRPGHTWAATGRVRRRGLEYSIEAPPLPPTPTNGSNISLSCKDSVGKHLGLDFLFHPVGFITQVV